MPRKTEILAEEASVSSPLRRSSRINVAANSPAPSTLTSKKNLQFDTEVQESKAPKARRTSVSQENSESEDKKENRSRGRRASVTKEETEQKPEPAKPRSRRSSAEPSVKEEEKRKTITRRRRSSAAEDPPEPEVVKPVRSRRSSVTDTHEEDDIAKKTIRGRRSSVQKEEPEEEPLKKSLRNRKDPITEKTEEVQKIDTKEKRPTRGRRSSTDKLEDEPEIKTTRLTPSKSRRRLSITENALSLEPIKELESEIRSRKSDSPIKSDLIVILDPSPVKEKTPEKANTDLEVITDKTKVTKSTPSKSKRRLALAENAVNIESVDELQSDTKGGKSGLLTDKNLTVVLSLTPVKKDRFKEAKTNLDLSVIDETSFTEPNPKDSSEPPQEGNENTLQQPEIKLEMENARDNVSEQNTAKGNTIDGVSKSDYPNISMGSDGSLKLHLNVSLPSSTSQNMSQNEGDDALNTSNTSNNSNKENMETNSPKVLNETEHILENKENLINTDSHDNRSEPKMETPIVVARISNVFRPKMIDNSFSEPMDVDQSPSILGATQNKLSLELEESAKTTPITKKYIRNIEIEGCSIAAEQETEPFTEFVCEKNIEVTESDSEDESFKLNLSISHVCQPEDLKNTPQIVDDNSTLDSECTEEDAIIEVCDESSSEQTSINENILKGTEDSEAPKQTTDLEKEVLEETEHTSDKEDHPKIQENSLFKQEVEKEQDAEYVDKPKSPRSPLSDEIKPEPKDVENLENLTEKQDEEEDVQNPNSQSQEMELVKVELEEIISSGKSSPQPQHIQDELNDENHIRKLEQGDMETPESHVTEKQDQDIVQELQFQEVESAKLELEESRPIKKSKSPQPQQVQVQERDELEVEKDLLAENNSTEIETKLKLESGNPQHNLDDDNAKISTSTENLNTEINQATENESPQKLRNVEMAKISPAKDLAANLEQKPKQPENLEPISEKQLMETDKLADITENSDEESRQTNESSLLERSEEEIEVTSTSPKRSVSPREVTLEPENQLLITEFPHHDLDSHFKTTEEYEEKLAENLDVELDQVQESTLLRKSKSPQPKGEGNTSKMLNSPLVEDAELQSNNETKVTATYRRKSDSSTSSNDIQETEFDKKSESPLSEECTEKGQHLSESERLKESCDSDEYEFDISSDDEYVEKTQELDLEQEPVKSKSPLQSLEITTNNEAQSKVCTSPSQGEITNTEDIENKENNISPKQSLVTVFIENIVNKEKVFEEYTDKPDEYDKMDSSEDEIEEKILNNTSHVVEEATSKLGGNKEVFVAEANTLKDPSVAKLETILNKESPPHKETQDELEEMANYDVNKINIEETADIDIVVSAVQENNEVISSSVDDPNINENKEKSPDMTKNITAMSNQSVSIDSTMEDPTTEYKEMEADFKDVTQDYQEQRTGKRKLKKVKKSVMKKTEESSEVDNQEEKAITSDTREIPGPSYSSKISSDIDVLKTEKKTKKKHKQKKAREDKTSSVGIINDKENISVTLGTSANDDSKTKKKFHPQKVEDVSENIAESFNKLVSMPNVEIEPKKIESDSENIERKLKTGKKKSKKVKTTSKKTPKEENIVELSNSEFPVTEKSQTKKRMKNASPIKKSKISKKKQKQNVTDSDISESIEDAELEENEVQKNLENLKTAANPIKKTESNRKKDFRNEIAKQYSSKDDKNTLKKIPQKEKHEEAELTRGPKRKSQKEAQAKDVEVPSSKKKFKKSHKKTKVAEQVSELEPTEKQPRELTQSDEDKDNTDTSNAVSKHRKRKADETSHYKNVADIEKKRKKIENKTESDSDEIDVSPQKQPVEHTALKEFTNSKLDEYLSKKISEIESEEEWSYTDTSQGEEEADTDREENEYICSMAEEGEEDTPSEDSNAIIDEGESINTTESETEPDDDYDEDDSFICDEEAEELLSGNEFDLGDEKKKKKSRIIPIDDYEDDVIKVERKKKPIKKRKSRIIVITDSSEDENGKLESHDDQHVKLSLPSLEQSTFDKDKSYSEEQINDIITLEAAPVQVAIKPVKSDVPTNTIDIEPEDEEKNKQKRRESSITIHENINVTEIKDAALSQRISNLVDTFCTSIRKGEISMNLSLQYATKEAIEASSQDESDDVFIDDSKEVMKMPNYKSEESDESESEGNSGGVETVLPDKLKGAKYFKFATTNSSSTGSSLNINYEESNTDEDMAAKKAERLSMSLDNIEDLDDSKKKSRKRRRLSKSLEDLHKPVDKKKKKTDKAFEKTKKNLTMKKKIKNPRRANKFKKQSSSESNLRTQTLSIMNQLITDVKNRPIRTIKPSRDMVDMTGSWITEIANVRPSTSLVSEREITEFKAGKVHPKDFRKQMLYDSARIKRVDTKTLLKKKGAYF